MGIVFFVLFSLAYAGLSAAPWVPLSNKEIRRMLSLAGVKPGEKVYDLGSGDGRILIIAAREFGAETVGYEISILPYIISKIRIAFARLQDKIKINFSSFYKTDLSEADVITVFLLPEAMKKLSPIFRKGLKPGARIVSYAFAMKDWEPMKVDKPDPKTMAIYLYRA
jgi:cyclopropane fatty-acyl-phospholipid synthase-like methyltransferase